MKEQLRIPKNPKNEVLRLKQNITPVFNIGALIDVSLNFRGLDGK